MWEELIALLLFYMTRTEEKTMRPTILRSPEKLFTEPLPGNRGDVPHKNTQVSSGSTIAAFRRWVRGYTATQTTRRCHKLRIISR
jgi:hypothetical protein